MNPLRLLLLPFSLIYAIITWFRNFLYDQKIFKTIQSQVPVISVGNLSVGGTGKTPHCEYLLQFLHKQGFNVAYLSRGYGRKSRGFRWVNKESSALEAGDEAVQIASKFLEVQVAVCENRALGIHHILEKYPDTDVIILDDAFQHRRIKPAINILLTEMTRPYSHDYLLPVGRLRESATGAHRADIIIVTKTTPVLPLLMKKYLLDTLTPLPHQHIFFTYYEYSEFIPVIANRNNCQPKQINHILLLTGIENPMPLREFLTNKGFLVNLKAFSDHHYFTTYELSRLLDEFESIPGRKKIILTTEKDLARMDNELIESLCNYPFYKIVVSIRFHEEQQEIFNQLILSKISNFHSNT
ncbi:MAG: tetraacyldisaccharide 4'-kinase [Bacteroidales bacterium]